jgi:hypothetical protein
VSLSKENIFTFSFIKAFALCSLLFAGEAIQARIMKNNFEEWLQGARSSSSEALLKRLPFDPKALKEGTVIKASEFQKRTKIVFSKAKSLSQKFFSHYFQKHHVRLIPTQGNPLTSIPGVKAMFAMGPLPTTSMESSLPKATRFLNPQWWVEGAPSWIQAQPTLKRFALKTLKRVALNPQTYVLLFAAYGIKSLWDAYHYKPKPQKIIYVPVQPLPTTIP